jgi:hypothetical protein
MLEQQAAKRIQKSTYALIIIVIALILATCLASEQLPQIKVRLLAKYPTEANQVKMYHDLYGSTPVVGANYSFTPPISAYHAILIALENGSWTNTDLTNMTIHVSIDYYIFYTNVTDLYQIAAKENITLQGRPNPNLNCPCQGFESLYQVNTPAANYQAQIFNGVSLRCIWTIIIEKDGVSGIPPPGYYLIDAATGESIPTGPLF